MKYLDAKKLPKEVKEGGPDIDNKMRKGTRIDQREFRSNPSRQKGKFAHPDVEKLAERYKIDTSKLTGTGPDGAITVKDVKDAAAAAKKAEKEKAKTESDQSTDLNA